LLARVIQDSSKGVNRLFLLSALSLGAAVSVRADIYEGTITQDDGGFTSTYTYTSATIDGTFYTDNFIEPDNSNDTLTGEVLLEWAPPYNLEFPNTPTALDSTIDDGRMTVSGGTVTGFRWNWEQGGFYADYELGEWSTLVYDQIDGQPDESAGGDLVFGDPVDISYQGPPANPPTPIPDSGSTLFLLVAGVIACFTFGKSWLPAAPNLRSLAQ
jgi:hypothetical protein